jgi:acetyl-CoA carboxylase alpha subunit
VRPRQRGALALAVADEVWMLENAVYSVISPEGRQASFGKSKDKTKEAAESLRITRRIFFPWG